MKLAYLTNTYPAPSHSFIRREILALEATGQPILRYNLRRHAGELVDPLDQAELAKTSSILEAGPITLGIACLTVAMLHPFRFVSTLFNIGKTGQRKRFLQLIYFAEACLLLQWLTREQVEHLHVHFGTNPAAVAMLCRLLGGPSYSFTVHGPDEFDAAPALALDTKAKYASHVIAISSYGKSQLARWLQPQDDDKLHIVHCGLDASFLITQPTPVPDVPKLVFVGRITLTKGVFVLAEALKLLRDRGTTCQVSLIGDGPQRLAFEDTIRQFGLADQVQICGFQSSNEVRAAILVSRALVLPSFAEGLPVVLMESLALARPVVTTWIAGVPELVEHHINGWLVPPGSASALADALEQVLKTPIEQLSQMGLRGREKVLQNYNAATEAAKLQTLFRQAIEAA